MQTAQKAPSRTMVKTRVFDPRMPWYVIEATLAPFIAKHGFMMDHHLCVAELGPKFKKLCFPAVSTRGFSEPPAPETRVFIPKMAHDFMPRGVHEVVGADRGLIYLSQFHHLLCKQGQGNRGLLPVDSQFVHSFVKINSEPFLCSAYWRHRSGASGWVIEAHEMDETFALRLGSTLILGPTDVDLAQCELDVPEPGDHVA